MTPVMLLLLILLPQEKSSDEKIYEGYIRSLKDARGPIQRTIESEIETCKRELQAIKESKAPDTRETKQSGKKDKKKDEPPDPRSASKNYGFYSITGSEMRFVPHSRESREQALEQKKAELKSLLLPRFDDWFLCELDIDNPKAGDVGLIKYRFKVDQVIDESTLLISNGAGSFMLRGLNTSDMVDGKSILIPALCFVEGTESYTTVLGAKRTVAALRALSDEQTKRMIAKAAEELPPPFQGRTWETADRKFSTEAEYVSHDKKTVTIRNKEGKEITVDIVRLSKADREWLKLVE